MRIKIIEPLSYPIHLDIEITNHCPLNCIMCPRQFMKRERGFMSWEVLRKIIEESKGKIKTCYFHQMGEPLLHPELVDMIKYIVDAEIWVSISTNGLSLTEGRAAALFDAGLDHLYLSLDSLKEEVYGDIRPDGKGRNCFKKIVENFDNCIALRKENPKWSTHLEMQIIKMDKNKGEVGAFKKKYKSLLEGIGRLSIKPYSFWAGHVPDFAPKPRVSKPYVCTMFNYSTSIYWNGDVTICCMDYDGFTKMGNVMEQSIEEIWNGEPYQKYREAHRDKDFSELMFCKGCYLASELKLENYGEAYFKLGEKDYLPHLNLKTIEFLEGIVKEDFEILEAGSGNSTVWFARRAKRVVAFENLSGWYYGIVDKLKAEGLDNVMICYDPEYPKKSFPKFKDKFDLILLDGADHEDSRVQCMKAAFSLIKSGGYIVVDDIHRKIYQEGIDYLNNLKQLIKLKDFEGEDAWEEKKVASVWRKE